MMLDQISLFDIQNELEEIAKDIRTDAQINRKVAYDVGEKIGGARKDEYALRKAFEENHSTDNLQTLEELSAVAAAEMINRDELFKHFSFKDEYQKGTEPVVARLKQLIIHRMDKYPSEDSADSRKKFLRAAKFVESEMEVIYTLQELIDWVYKIRHQLTHEAASLSYYEGRLAEVNEKLESLTPDVNRYKHYQKVKQDYINSMEDIKTAQELPIGCLGKKFKNFFRNHTSANNTINNVQEKVKSWDDLLTKKKGVKRRKTKPVWERELPERPDRIGGTISDIRTPEQLLNTFQFRGVEFGHYTDDQRATDHIFRSSEAFFDLVDVLDLNHYFSISFNGELAMGFGSRGRGSALGHYEPSAKIINLTRDRGSLGIMAHEWFHALDNWLYNVSHKHKNGLIGYTSNCDNIGLGLSISIKEAFETLVESITEGGSIAHVENTNKPGDSWRIGQTLKTVYKRNQGDLEAMMYEFKDMNDKQLEERLNFISKFYRSNFEQEKEKAEKKAVRDLKKKAQALAWWHEKQTGERVANIPLPTNHSYFFQSAIDLDKGTVGKYWSSSVELTARAFEAYVEDKLREMGRRNDYLVCGTDSAKAFPMGDEREKINEQFDEIFRLIRKVELL